MVTLDAIDLGTVTEERQSKSSNLFNFPLPLSDSDEALLLDIFGTSRTISISGKFVGTQSEIATFVGQIESIQDGEQSGSAYVGSLITTPKEVLIQTFDWTWSSGSVNQVDYSLSLLEGTVI